MHSRKYIFLAMALLLASTPALAAQKPAAIMQNTFNELKKNSNIDQVTAKLAMAIDQDKLQQRLLGDLPVTLTAEQQKNLLVLVEKQLTKSLLNLVNQKESFELPKMNEQLTEHGGNLTFTAGKDGKTKEITLHFVLNGDNYLLQDITVSQKSLLDVYQKQFKKLFKKHTYEEVVTRLQNS